MTVRGIRALITPVCFLALVVTLDMTSRAAGDDVTAGKDVFNKRCSGCHAADSDKEGPRLRGVLGRKAGSVSGFQYSDALRNSGIVWNEALVSKWLEDTQAVVKDNDMEFRVPNPAERQAVVAYLKSLGK